MSSAAVSRCALHDAVGRAEHCPGAACPFWEDGGAIVAPGCAIERLGVNLSSPQRAEQLLELRSQLEVARRDGVRAAGSLFELLGFDRDV